jgi:hypothetical protein
LQGTGVGSGGRDKRGLRAGGKRGITEKWLRSGRDNFGMWRSHRDQGQNEDPGNEGTT